MIRVLSIFILILSLTACNHDMSDLNQYFEDAKEFLPNKLNLFLRLTLLRFFYMRPENNGTPSQMTFKLLRNMIQKKIVLLTEKDPT